METLKKIASFFVICIFVLGAIGCTAYLFYFGKPLFGIVSIIMAAMAVPTLIAAWNTLMDKW